MPWIKLSQRCRNKRIGEGEVLVNTDNIACVFTGQGEGYKGVTLVAFTGSEDNFIPVEESVDRVEEILINAMDVQKKGKAE